MRRTLGIAVFSGMLGVTLFGVFLTPIFYDVIQAWNDWRGRKHPARPQNVNAAHSPGSPLA
jgi:hypothetical protein